MRTSECVSKAFAILSVFFLKYISAFKPIANCPLSAQCDTTNLRIAFPWVRLSTSDELIEYLLANHKKSIDFECDYLKSQLLNASEAVTYTGCDL